MRDRDIPVLNTLEVLITNRLKCKNQVSILFRRTVHRTDMSLQRSRKRLMCAKGIVPQLAASFALGVNIKR